MSSLMVTKGKPSRKGRRGKKKKLTTRKMASFAYRAIRGTEVKHHTQSTVKNLDVYDSGNITTSTLRIDLSQVSQGLEPTQRIGNDIRIIRFSIRLFFKQPSTFSSHNVTKTRVLFTRWVEPDGTSVPILPALLADISEAHVLQSAYNTLGSSVYRNHWDELVVMSRQMGTTFQAVQKDFHWPSGIRVAYKSKDANYINIQENAFSLSFVTRYQELVDAQRADVEIYVRYYYIDL